MYIPDWTREPLCHDCLEFSEPPWYPNNRQRAQSYFNIFFHTNQFCLWKSPISLATAWPIHLCFKISVPDAATLSSLPSEGHLRTGKSTSLSRLLSSCLATMAVLHLSSCAAALIACGDPTIQSSQGFSNSVREQVFVNGVRLILKAKVDSGKEAEATQRTAAQAAQQSGESGGAQQHRQPPLQLDREAQALDRRAPQRFSGCDLHAHEVFAAAKAVISKQGKILLGRRHGSGTFSRVQRNLASNYGRSLR